MNHTEPVRPIIEVQELTVSIRRGRGRPFNVLESVDLSIAQGETVGLVGESGSGKTMVSLAIMGLLPSMAQVVSGDIRLLGESLFAKSADEVRDIRGRVIAMIPQNPFTSLDPMYSVGAQMAEPLRMRKGLRRRDARDAAIAALRRIGLPSAEQRLGAYPHQLSGGMRQRVVSAIALEGEPRLLIADEPTTALDMTSQAQYLMLLRHLQSSAGFGLIFISHDLAVVRELCSRVVVMYSGEIVEEGSMGQVFDEPRHPYTGALVAAHRDRAASGRLRSIEGQAPSVADRLTGCRYAPRCQFARDICTITAPDLTIRGSATHRARCLGTEPAGWIRE